MKNLFLILALSLQLPSMAQRVFVVKSKNDANLIVYVTTEKREANLIVYKTNLVSDTEIFGRWLFLPNKKDSYYKIFFTKYKESADIIIYYSKNKYDVGFRK